MLASEQDAALKEREELHQQMETYRQIEVEKINRYARLKPKGWVINSLKNV